MVIKNISQTIKEVEQKLESEYSIWNSTNNSNLIEECIYNILSLEVKLNNLYKEAKQVALEAV